VSYLIDTSVLVRLANVADLSYPAALRAVMELHRRGEVLHISPQNLAWIPMQKKKPNKSHRFRCFFG
jgi:hypothetical protein